MFSLTELIKLETPITVCDVGAALGESPSYQSLVDRGAARIVGFEPERTECERLNVAYGAPHLFLPYFVGDGRDQVFHQTNWNLTGSLFEPNRELNECFNNLVEVTQLVAKHPVTTVRLDDIAELDDIDFLKIDVQGAELMIFQNGRRRLSTTLMIQTEVEFIHHYKNQPLFADVDGELRAQGFQFHTFQGFGSRAFKPLAKTSSINDGFRQIIWSDAIYVRDWMKLAELSREKLQKYAVLMHDIMSSYDLCHVVLEELQRRDGVDWPTRYRERLGVQNTPPADAPRMNR